MSGVNLPDIDSSLTNYLQYGRNICFIIVSILDCTNWEIDRVLWQKRTRLSKACIIYIKETLKDGYHCWAEFYADGKWWPIDISEADKYTSLSTYYFGHNPANRIELSHGRDLVADPSLIRMPCPIEGRADSWIKSPERAEAMSRWHSGQCTRCLKAPGMIAVTETRRAKQWPTL